MKKQGLWIKSSLKCPVHFMVLERIRKLPGVSKNADIQFTTLPTGEEKKVKGNHMSRPWSPLVTSVHLDPFSIR